MRVSFLLGAGASVAAGMPCTKQMTDWVLSGDDMFRDSVSQYSRKSRSGPASFFPDGLSDEAVSKIAAFLRVLERIIRENYARQPRKNVTYEDLFYVARQIYEDETGNFENPIVASFVEKIASEVERITGAASAEYIRGWDSLTLAREACAYIEGVICSRLSVDPIKEDHLTFLCNAAADTEISRADIFTLNHDMLIERCLGRANLACVNGFTSEVHSRWRWKPEVYDDCSARLRLFKLHGSLNWSRFALRRTASEEMFLGYVTQGHKWDHLENFEDCTIELLSYSPIILVGTHNKLFDYTSGEFAELFFRFYRELDTVSTLVVCGYGFGDKGINTRIIEWLYSRADRRIIVIDPNMDTLQERARFAISRAWLKLKQDNRLIELQRGVEDLKWEDVKPHLV